MKSLVAFLLVLATVISGAIAAGQTPSGAKSSTAKSRADTMRICQGVPIPDGYVIVGYMTSAACPHGAYIVKKQNEYESSLSVNGDVPRTSTPSRTSAGSTTRKTEKRDTSSSNAANGSTRSGGRSRVPREGASSSAMSANRATRPRRVGADSAPTDSTEQQAQTESQTPPTLIGSAAAPLRPPTLVNAGSTSTAEATSAASRSAAQPTPEEVEEGDVVRVETSLVTVPVSVLDRDGRFVPNLKREDFSIFENGVEQSIAYFEPAEKPFTVALLLDTSASTHFHLNEIREAAIAFAKQLRPQDRVLIVSFNDEVLLLTPEATNDLNLVQDVIEENANTGNSTRLYDAVHLTIAERLNKIKGRKAIVLFTDGVDTSSQQSTFQSTLREVDELDALIYPIQYDTTDYMRSMQAATSGNVTVITTRSGPFGMTTSQQTYNVPINGGLPLPGTSKEDYERADQYLHALAEKTGGRLYQANDQTQLAEAFARIAEELRRQYSLGYYPKTDSAEGNEQRQIRVKVREPNLAVKARASYVKSSVANSKQ